MKNRTLNTWLRVGFASLASMGLTLGSAFAQDDNSDLFDSPFDTCFKNGYHMDLVTPDQAYDTARCFSSLLEIDNADGMTPGASPQTILQYAASWYEVAAENGHELAQSRLEASRMALNIHEQNAHLSFDNPEQQLLASEKIFQQFDKNNDSLLSKAEIASSPELNASFAKTDIDNDGMVSFGEYAVSSGEATAAGKRQVQVSAQNNLN